MKVITRKVGESVVIDGEVFMTVLSMEEGNIRFAFDAPLGTKIESVNSATNQKVSVKAFT